MESHEKDFGKRFFSSLESEIQGIHNNTNYKQSKQETAIQTLRTIAYLLLVFSIIGAILVWVTMSTIEVGLYSRKEINPAGVSLGFVFLISGVATWAFLIVISDIAKNLLFVRKHYEDKTENDSI